MGSGSLVWRIETIPGIRHSRAAADILETGAADCLFISAAVPYPEQDPEPPAAPVYSLSAADTVLAVLTDTAITVTSRSPVRVQARVRLGAAGDAAQDLGAIEAAPLPRVAGSFALMGVNAPELGRVLGSSLTSVADALDRIAARRGAALADLLGLLATPREQSSLAPASQPD